MNDTWVTAKSKEELLMLWPTYLEEVEKDFERLCQLDRNDDEIDSAEVQAWWVKMSLLLMIHARSIAQGVELQPFPSVQIARLANVCEEFGNGNLPALVSDAIDRKRTYWRAERRHIAWAVTYITMCKEKQIDDSSYNKTVLEAYGLSARAVQGWVKRKEEICRGLFLERNDPDVVRQEMLASGAVYKKLGRGLGANS